MIRLLLIALTFIISTSVLKAQQLTHRQGDLLVRFEQKADVEEHCRQISRSEGQEIRPERLLSEPLNIWLCRFDYSRISEEEMLQTVRSSRGVHTAQLNHLIELRQTIPDDTLFENQWQWLNMGTGGTLDADVDADLAWDITTGGLTENGDSIVVAVIDDGIDIDHPDLMNNLWINRNEIPDNGIDDDGNGYVDDYYGWNLRDSTDNVGNGGHGVSVSGMIAAEGNNLTGVTGINWNAKIMTIVYNSLDEAMVIESYTYALKQRQLYEETDGAKGAFVVATNSSWGIDGGQPEDAPLWCAFYDTLGAHGILSCGATANRDWNIDEVGDLPTGCSSEYLLSVTATDVNDERTFSAYGMETIDVGAPGDDIYTTFANGGFGTTSGTSFASPLTAGLIALLYSVDCPKLTGLIQSDPASAALLIRDAIFFTVDQTDLLKGEIKYGGRVNAYRAVQFLLDQCSSCPAPYRIRVHQVIDTSALVRWDLLDTVGNVKLQYRMLGDTTWNEQIAEESPYRIDGLQACRSYEVRLQSECADTNSIYTFPFLFKTDGCCEAPLGIEQLESDYGNAMVRWESVLAAEKYIYRYREEPSDPWIEEETMDTMAFIPGLKPCNYYEFELATLCDTGQTPFKPIGLAVPHCQACSELDYCGAVGNSTEDEWIESIQFDNQSYTSGANLGYLNGTNEVNFSFFPGQTGDLTVDVQYAGITFEEYHRIYLDANQNGLFEEAEIIADTTEGIVGDFVSNYRIPPDAKPGITRMRVILKYAGGENETPIACDTFGFGEVEDYCVRITDLNTCDPVDTAFVRDVSEESFEAYWDPADSAIAYNIRYRDTMSGGDWTYESALDTFLMINGLEKCTDYEVQIRTVCPFDTTAYLAHSIIRTECETAVDRPDHLLSSINIFPNPSRSDVQLRFNAERATRMQVKFYTPKGQLIEQIGRDVPRGHSNFAVTDLSRQPSGLYLMVIDTPYKRYTRKVVKVD